MEETKIIAKIGIKKKSLGRRREKEARCNDAKKSRVTKKKIDHVTKKTRIRIT